MERDPKVADSLRSELKWEAARIRFQIASFDTAASEHVRLRDRIAATSVLTRIWQLRLEPALFSEIERGGSNALPLISLIGDEGTAKRLEIARSRTVGGLMRMAITNTISEIRNGRDSVTDPDVSVYERIKNARRLNDRQRDDARGKLPTSCFPGAPCNKEALDSVQVLGEIGNNGTLKVFAAIPWASELPPNESRALCAAISNAVARIRERGAV